MGCGKHSSSDRGTCPAGFSNLRDRKKEPALSEHILLAGRLTYESVRTGLLVSRKLLRSIKPKVSEEGENGVRVQLSACSSYSF